MGEIGESYFDEAIRNPESRKKLRDIEDREVRKGDKSKGENPRSKYSTEKGKHTLSMFIFTNVQTFATFALLGWLLGYPELSTALGAEESSFNLSALAFFILFTPLSIVLGLINNSWTRHNEYQADT